jgi:Domain of unknown function (DUF4419)
MLLSVHLLYQLHKTLTIPVTIHPAAHPAIACRGKYQRPATSVESLLKDSYPLEYHRCKKITQSSFDKSSFPSTGIYPESNGFFQAAHAANGNHHRLPIRPEDVWLAILVRLSFHLTHTPKSSVHSLLPTRVAKMLLSYNMRPFRPLTLATFLSG